ncbi:uncharacterized protein LOC106660400 isoform X1 [Trichogramma pretiosum]|uniref:uncharacterized protein LOC106660400 isoform X1 n=1 Tax=Trichogramma pretiosum TaxID=7493 RepID=UPI0006C9BD4C|nr:uncharacterized protein LOC106660400 isoform X1 [Trichogramma pretiosum]
MKEQWKRLDTDAKLLVNVSEGGHVPISIQVPYQALGQPRDDCCKRTLLTLRLLILLVLLGFSSWLLISTYYNYHLLVDTDKDVAVSKVPFFNSEKQIIAFRNEVLNSLAKNDEKSSPKIIVQEEYPTDDNEPTSFIEKIVAKQAIPVDVNIIVDGSFEKDAVNSHESHEEANESETSDKADHDKLFHILTAEIPVVEVEDVDYYTKTEGEDEKKNEEKSVDEVDRSMQSSEDDHQAISWLDALDQTLNFLSEFEKDDDVPDSENSNEEANSSQNSREKHTDASSIETQFAQVHTNYETSGVPTSQSAEQDVTLLRYVARHLEHIVGKNSQLLVWYYENKNDKIFADNPWDVRRQAAELLYSDDITTYSKSFETVWKLIQYLNLEEGSDAAIEEYIVNRLRTKQHMFYTLYEKQVYDDQEIALFIQGINTMELRNIGTPPATQATPSEDKTTEKDEIVPRTSEDDPEPKQTTVSYSETENPGDLELRTNGTTDYSEPYMSHLTADKNSEEEAADQNSEEEEKDMNGFLSIYGHDYFYDY